MTSKRFAELIAELISGAQVPMSIGVLGAAKQPLIELRKELTLTGWHTTEEARQAVLNWLNNPHAERKLAAIHDLVTFETNEQKLDNGSTAEGLLQELRGILR